MPHARQILQCGTLDPPIPRRRDGQSNSKLYASEQSKALPEVRKEDVRISVENGMMTIGGERRV